MPTNPLPVAQLKAELFKVLAHPVRIQSLEVLVDGERSVGDLASELNVEISHLSQQLAVLRRGGVVTTRRDGTTVFYRIRDERFVKLLAVARDMLIDSLDDSRQLLDTLRGEASDSR